MYRKAPTKPWATNSSQSWPALPITRLPHLGQPGLWPIDSDLSLPIVVRVLPYPMIGEDTNTRADSNDRELLRDVDALKARWQHTLERRVVPEVRHDRPEHDGADGDDEHHRQPADEPQARQLALGEVADVHHDHGDREVVEQADYVCDVV